MNLIEIKNLKFAYNEENIIDNLNFTLKEGDFLGIIGENGSGKSTLIKLLLGIEKKDGGSIKILGEDIEKFDQFEKIAYVPQVNDSNKISFPITCREYVVVNLYKEFSFFKKPGKRQREKVHDIFEILKIENLEKRPFNTLSGGQQQRVMIARALVSNPKILILDEPTVGIDSANKKEFLELCYHINKKHKITILMVTHEMEIVKPYINRLARLKEGKITDVSL